MDYSINQFVSELGGAAGIVLGVSLFTVVKGIILYIHVLYICLICTRRTQLKSGKRNSARVNFRTFFQKIP